MCSAESRVGQKAEFSFTSLRFCGSHVGCRHGQMTFCCDKCFSIFIFFFSLQVPTASRWKSTRKCSCKTVWGSEVEQMGERKLKEPSDNPQWSKSELFTSFHGTRKTTQYRVQSCSQSRNHTRFFRFRFRLRGQKCDLNGKKWYVLFWYGEGRFD